MLEDSVLPSLQSPIRYSSLCQVHDALMEALVQEQALLLPSNHTGEKDSSTGGSASNDREQQQSSTATPTESIIVRQADYLRALQLTCKLLLGILTTPSVSASQTSMVLSTGEAATTKKKVLEQTIQRCEILLEDLAAHQINGVDPSATTRRTSEATASHKTSSLPESQYSILRRNYFVDNANPHVVPHKEIPGLYIYRTTDDDNNDDETNSSTSSSDEDDNLMSLDRATLAQEEQDLIHMASTPIPGE